MKRKELEKIAHLARLELSPKEFEQFKKELKEILNFLECLNSINIEEVKELEKQKMEFREDRICFSLNQKNIIEMFPEQKNSLAVVPKTFYKNSNWEYNSNSRRI